ncbi:MULTISPECIES: SoxR reducing system RseC family protein [Vibrio]|jgi:sigma-E factor negative regulatory protein RseC|uniref:Transcriptional regulator n=1 Tax=Vibrio diazotrophicus TaxID=685 RepID=A0A2J8G6W0_VIBDI|nr:MULTISPECIES: SoxR reducing system RseC family protein [Vibrio]MCF7363108.1 SoxR reducing system RseC family protein [Vibrio sp. A1-b2]PNH81748.1 transcriptional regulator [Vibrio diazotrophicus]PNH92366.1 transcriptional regulator [Vibrio diazotrophicus]PNI04752.1 transcriptional regulator [Vibrio diazotrophicus]
MMTALATVMAVQTKEQGFHVELSCEQKTSCSSCSSAKSCGTGIVSKAIGGKSLRWHLDTDKSVSQGQVVEIGFPEKSLLQSAALVYLVPLLMMILGAWLADSWLAPMLGMGEGIIILTSLVFIGLGIRLAKTWSGSLEKRTEQEVVLLRVLGEPIA